MPVCHYCGEDYQATTDIEQMRLNNPSEHNVCSTCLFDVIANGATLEPLPEYEEEIEQ